jgi:hypothetical protein
MILPTVTVSNNLIWICSVLYPRRVFLRRRLVVDALLTCLNALLCNLDGGFDLVWFDSTEPLESIAYIQLRIRFRSSFLSSCNSLTTVQI